MKYAAPLQSSLQKWLREKHYLHVMIGVDDLDWWWQLYDSSANGRLKEYNQITESYAGKKTYEEAMEEGLFKALEILKTIQEKKPVINFTTPCFIRKNNTELRSKLRELGYTVLLDIFDSPCLTTVSCGFAIPSPELNKYGAYDCGENENLFLALAGTRDGKPARIICFDRRSVNGCSIVALIDEGVYENFLSYNLQGRFHENTRDENDLFMATVKKEGWINLYYNGEKVYTNSTIVHSSEKDAVECRLRGSYMCTVKIEWDEPL